MVRAAGGPSHSLPPLLTLFLDEHGSLAFQLGGRWSLRGYWFLVVQSRVSDFLVMTSAFFQLINRTWLFLLDLNRPCRLFFLCLPHCLAI